MRVNKQANISFSIGKYHDEVLYDVVPMHAGDILLGRPWQFDRKTKHDGYLNRYSFTKDGRKTILTPLSSKDAHEDQCKLERMREEARLKEESETNVIGTKEREKKREGQAKPKERSLIAREGEVRRALYSEKPLLIVIY